MFFKSDEVTRRSAEHTPGLAPAKPKARNAPSVIARGVSITGDLIGDGDLQIDGTVEGKVKCDQITIGESGSINGQLKADTVLIAGQFKGKVTTRVLTMTNTARVDGTLIVQESLAIEAGALFEGQCQRTQLRGADKDEHHDEKFDEIKKQLTGGMPAQPKKIATG